MPAKSRLPPPPSSHPTWLRGRAGPVAGVIVSFDRAAKGGKVEAVMTRNHRVVRDPAAEIHGAFGQFRFRDGYAMLTPAQAAMLRNVVLSLGADC